MIVCRGPFSEPHPETIVVGAFSGQLDCWVYDCPSCGYDVRVPCDRAPHYETDAGDRIDLHRLAVTMADLKAGKR